MTTMQARYPFTGASDYSFEVADAAAVAAACGAVLTARACGFSVVAPGGGTPFFDC